MSWPKSIALGFCFCLMAEFALERAGVVDSIGWWYTALVAAVFSLPMAVVFRAFIVLWKSIR